MSKTKKIVPKQKGYIISNPSHSRMDDTIQLLRITITDEETKIDFGYQAGEYEDGGWIHIKPETFIRARESESKMLIQSTKNLAKYILKRATNIPYGPEKLHFNSTIEWRYFSLYFPRLPDGTKSFDLIEKEFGDETEFNFFNIRLDEEEQKSMIY
jgi:hypothetical protein